MINFINILFGIIIGIVFVFVYAALFINWRIPVAYLIGIGVLTVITNKLSKKIKQIQKNIVSETTADIVKMHITINFDEYMDPSHRSYEELKSMIFSRDQWKELIRIIRKGKKEIMLLLNDIQAIEFGLSFNPEYVEIHSVCLNDIFMLKKLKNSIKKTIMIVAC
jgi:uncharacterized membrane-anchored protein YitT (DUF2179 family)